MAATIKTEKRIVQDIDLYLDVDCDAGYDNDDRIWRRRVFLDKETNGVVTSDEIFFSESGDSGFEETDAVPADIEEALEACVDRAVGGILKPRSAIAANKPTSDMEREMLERWASNLSERNAIEDFWGWVSSRLDADVWFSDIDVDAELDDYHKIDQAQLERERRQLLESCRKE